MKLEGTLLHTPEGEHGDLVYRYSGGIHLDRERVFRNGEQRSELP